MWIWSITVDMWDRLGSYVEGVQSGRFKRKVGEDSQAIPNYGRYFRALSEEAREQLRRAD